MDIRRYLGKRTQKEQSDKSSGEESDTEDSLYHADKSKTFMTCPVSNKLSAQQKKKCYKKKLSYKKVWEKFILGFSVKILMLVCCVLFVRNGDGHLQVQMVGGRQGELDWNHTTELLKQHSRSKWHQDSSITVRMAKHIEQQNVIEMHCAGAARQAEEQKKKNRGVN